MPDLDSLSFALLVPFAVCFILIFIVCCYADEIKEICRLPSPLPSTYIGAEHSHSHRHRHRRNRRNSERHERRRTEQRNRDDDIQTLIINEEGRSRNISESSSEYLPQQSVIIIHEQGPSTSGVNNESMSRDSVSNGAKSKTNGSAFVQSAQGPSTSGNFSKNVSIGLNSPNSEKPQVKVETCVQVSQHSQPTNLTSGSSNTRDSNPSISNSTHAGVHLSPRNLSRSTLPDALTSYLSGDFRVTSVNSLTDVPSTYIESSHPHGQAETM